MIFLSRNPPADDCDCQNLPNCFYGVIIQRASHCPCDNQSAFPSHVSTGNCSEPTARCRRVEMEHARCETEFNGEQECSHDRVLGPCGPGDPPPSPPPSPEPSPSSSPSPTPNLATRPNPSNCTWNTLIPPGRWICTCLAGEPADYPRLGFSNFGCPLNMPNDGRDCCQRLGGTQPCPDGHRDDKRCECVPDPTPTPTPETPDRCSAEREADCVASLGRWLPDRCECDHSIGPHTPVLLDTAGDGFRLTGAAGGVGFDIDGDGRAERLGWTSQGSDDAWLALDRDGDGMITSGRELFGNFTPQPDPPPGRERNGFLALAEFDRPHNGGDGDGVIDARDAVFVSLRLWRDANHDGVSEAGELHGLAALDVVRLHLSHKESRRADEHGSRFRYRAKVDDARGARAGRWAWDVFLVAAP